MKGIASQAVNTAGPGDYKKSDNGKNRRQARRQKPAFGSGEDDPSLAAIIVTAVTLAGSGITLWRRQSGMVRPRVG